MSVSEPESNQAPPIEIHENNIDNQSQNMGSNFDQSYRNELADLPMGVLVERRKRYIEEMKLEKAQEVDRLIKEKNSQDKTRFIPRIEDYLLSKVEQLYLSYKQNCDNYKLHAYETEMEIRENGDNLFVATRNDHIAQLTYYEKLRALKLIHMKKKPVAKAIEYETRSKKSAYRNDYQQAFYYRDLAVKEREDAFMARKEEIERTLDTIKSKLFESMRNDMRLIADKIKTQLDKNDSILTRNLDVQLRTFKIQVQEEVQKAIAAICSIFKDPETRVELKNEINDLVTIKLNELSMPPTVLSPDVSPRAKSSLSNRQPSVSPTKSMTNTSSIRSKEDNSQFDSIPPSVNEEEAIHENSEIDIVLDDNKHEDENNEIQLNLDNVSNNELNLDNNGSNNNNSNIEETTQKNESAFSSNYGHQNQSNDHIPQFLNEINDSALDNLGNSINIDNQEDYQTMLDQILNDD